MGRGALSRVFQRLAGLPTSHWPPVGAAEHLTPSSCGVEARCLPREKPGSRPKDGGKRLLQPKQAAGNGPLETVSAHQLS